MLCVRVRKIKSKTHTRSLKSESVPFICFEKCYTRSYFFNTLSVIIINHQKYFLQFVSLLFFTKK